MRILSDGESASLRSAHGFAKVEEALRTRFTVYEQAILRLPVGPDLTLQYSEFRAKISELQNIMQMLDIMR